MNISACLHHCSPGLYWGKLRRERTTTPDSILIFNATCHWATVSNLIHLKSSYTVDGLFTLDNPAAQIMHIRTLFNIVTTPQASVTFLGAAAARYPKASDAAAARMAAESAWHSKAPVMYSLRTAWQSKQQLAEHYQPDACSGGIPAETVFAFATACSAFTWRRRPWCSIEVPQCSSVLSSIS